MTDFPVNIEDGTGQIRIEGTASFGGSPAPAATASPTFTGTVTLPAVVMAADLPTADPTNAGQLWSNAGVVTVSAG